MIKNMMLSMVFAFGSFFQTTACNHGCNKDAAKHVVVAGLVGSVASAGLMYAHYHEDNAVKVEKIERIWRHIIDNVARTRPEDFSKLVPTFKNFDIFVYELHASLESRYSSWVTPWNWLPSMRLAYKKAVLLQILLKYLDALHYWHAFIPSDSIERLGKSICGANSTVTTFVEQLTSDIDKLNLMMKDIYCPFGDILYEHLRAIREIAMQSNAYRVENAARIHQV